jgi:hypothetical protein
VELARVGGGALKEEGRRRGEGEEAPRCGECGAVGHGEDGAAGWR